MDGGDDRKLSASTIEASLSSDYEREDYVVRIAGAWTQNDFEASDMETIDYTRISAAFERKLSDNIWIVFEIGETFDGPSGEDESFSRIALKLPEGMTSLSSVLGLN